MGLGLGLAVRTWMSVGVQRKATAQLGRACSGRYGEIWGDMEARVRG